MVILVLAATQVFQDSADTQVLVATQVFLDSVDSLATAGHQQAMLAQLQWPTKQPTPLIILPLSQVQVAKRSMSIQAC